MGRSHGGATSLHPLAQSYLVLSEILHIVLSRPKALTAIEQLLVRRGARAVRVVILVDEGIGAILTTNLGYRNQFHDLVRLG